MNRLGIIGLGQIGGSVAAALRRNGAPYHLSGRDRDGELARLAKRRRMIRSVFNSDVDLIKNVDILVLALPMFDIHRLLEEQRRLLEEKVLVMDTGSTKQDVIGIVERLKMRNFVGGHPYAGTEKSAPAAWDADLFVNQRFFLTPPRRCSRRAYSEAKKLVGLTGADPQRIDPEDHDRMFAFASGLPHLIAYALVASLCDKRRRRKIDTEFLAHSFSSSTRVAKSPPETIAQFLWQNRRQLKREIEIFKHKLETFSLQLSMDSIDSFMEEVTHLRGLKDNLERIDETVTSRKNKPAGR
jgi:prephenate dehydrogenase